MFPAPFQYREPTSADEAVALLGEYGADARILAGGQTLIAAMNLGLARPRVVVDLHRVTGLGHLQLEASRIGLGALVRHRFLERSPHIRRVCPLLADAAALVGNPRVRSRGTLGGSLAHADPSAELPTTMLALESEVRLEGPAGRRGVPAADFFVGALTTSLRDDELIVEVRVPLPPPGTGWAFEEVSRRPGDWAVVGVAALVTLRGEGACSDARLAFGGVGPVPRRAPEAERRLRGAEPDAAHIAQVAEVAADEVEVESDAFVSARYRRHLVRVLAVRALERAIGRASARDGAFR